MSALEEYRAWAELFNHAGTEAMRARKYADAAIAELEAEREAWRAFCDEWVDIAFQVQAQDYTRYKQAEADVEYWKHHYKDCKASDYRNAMAAQQAEAENERLQEIVAEQKNLAAEQYDAGVREGRKQVEAEVERLKKMLHVAYRRSGQAWNWSEDEWLEVLRKGYTP